MLTFLHHSRGFGHQCLFLSGVFLAGCSQPTSPSASTESTQSPATVETGHGHDHEHGHSETGPHHGDLVELGNEEYHAEVVHDDSGSVTVYVLDSAAKESVPIEASDVLVNLTRDGKPQQFKLPASPESSDPPGKSSKFHLKDAELAKLLDDEKSAPKLVLSIAGKQYTGKVEHHHDHDEAGHAE